MTDTYPQAELLIALLAGRPVDLDTVDEACWLALVEVARQQGVAPLLSARLKQRGMTAAPAAAQSLRSAYLSSFARNTRLLQEAASIMAALRAAGIPVMPLKGVFLAEAVYGNVALRPMGDVDLLVRLAHLEPALTVLRQLGYGTAGPFDLDTECQLNAHLPQLTRPGGVKLELHWSIASPRHPGRFGRDDLEGLWARAIPATVAGVPALALSPTDLLLHLCWHLSAQHRFDDIDLRNYVDIDLVCRRFGDAIDWQAFTARATAWDVAPGVRLALQLAKEWTDAPVPDSVFAALDSPPPDEAVTAWVRRKTFVGSSSALKGDLPRFAGSKRFTDKLRAVRDALFPPRVVMAAKYHTPATSWRILGCYPRRFEDLWVRYSRALWQLLRRDKQLTAEARQEALLREYLDSN